MKNENLISFRTKEGTTYVDQNEIIFCEVSGNSTYLKTVKKTMKTPLPLKNIEEKLDESQFIKINRSCIVNTDFIKDYKPDSRKILLKNRDSLLISVRKKRVLLKYIYV